MSHPMPLSVLLVEDDPDVQMIAQLSLEDVGGFIVSVCSTGEEAIRRLDTFEPDVVLLDAVLAGDKNGVETLRAIQAKKLEPRLPIVFLTARTEEADVRLFLRLGAAGVIHKPFDPMTLPSTLGEILQNTMRDALPNPGNGLVDAD